MPEQEMQTCLAVTELQQLIRQSPEQTVVIDVRSVEEYAEKHIPQAINIPLHELANRSTELSKDLIIVTVCGKGGGRSAQGAALLKQLGFSKVAPLCGGTFGWYDLQDTYQVD